MSSRYFGGLVRKDPLVLNPAAGNAANGVFTMSQYMQAVKNATWPAYDPYFKQTVLSLHGNGTNGAQNNTFLDGSTNNFTITRNGNTTQGTFSPFSVADGQWSNYFDGSGDYLSTPNVAALRLGAGDFTVEAWIYPQRLTNTYGQTICGTYGFVSSADRGWSLGLTSTGYFNIFLGGSSGAGFSLTSSTITTINQWSHVAAVRSGTSVKLYLNGVEVASGTSSKDEDYSVVDLNIGTNRADTLSPATGNAGTSFQGYISSVRIVKGTAVYTSAFTPPTAPLTAITNTSLLTCQSNRFRDASSNNFTITRNGDVRVTPFSPFAPSAAYDPAVNGGSGYFDGTGDSLSSSTNFEASNSTSTFTFEGFVYPTTFSTIINIFGGISVTNDTKTIAAEVNTSGQVALYWFDGAIKRCTGNSVMQLNAWNYFAIVVSSNAISIYVNKTTADTLSGTTTLTNRTQSQGLGVGAYFNDPPIGQASQFFNGYLSSLRYSTVARTISSIPTAPFASDANARWLLNFTNAGIFDNTGKNVLETVGNAQIDTTTKKYGTGSMEFDGTGDYLLTNGSDKELGSGNFTIEFWVYFNSVSGVSVLIDYRPASTSGAYPLIYRNGTSIIYGVNSGDRITSTTTFAISTWYHIAVVRSSGSTKMYVNGTNEGSAYSDSTFMLAPTNRPVIGGNGFTLGNEQLNGFIDDLRITKGIARYTANFTAQTSQWQDQ